MSQSNNEFDWIMVKLASSEEIQEWSRWEIVIPDTVNYRTGKPKEWGLFCEKIYWPTKNYECSCGKYKWVRYKWIVCDRCWVEVVSSRVRRERMGHIKLNSPVIHIWYYKAHPSVIWSLLNLSSKEIEKVINYVKYIVLDINEKQKENIIKTIDRDFHNKEKEIEDIFDKEVLQLSEKWLNQDDYKKEYEALLALKEKNLSTLNKEYSDTKSMLKSLVVGSTIHERDYRLIYHKYEWAFTFGSWVGALQQMLKSLDLKSSIDEIKQEIKRSKWKKREDAFKRLKIFINFYTSWISPESVILTNLPVIPADLRPIVQLDGGKFASSDINIFYRRVLMRNIRLKKMIDSGMPEVVKRNEIRLLQESVNNLFIWEKNQSGKWWAWVKVYKSLTDILVGKEGRFRKNLLGKRVDYSWRSVITVWPELKLNECWVPIYIAVRIFTPFIISRLLKLKIAHTPKQAEKLIKEETPIVLKLLKEVIKDKYVLLNRAPTLHRLGIQGFKIKLMPWKTIRLHPLVCPAFNADFDGDQMWLHLPISKEAQQEAAEFLSADKNILKPSSWEPIITHTQELILWIYYLTHIEKESPIKAYFRNMEEVLKAYENSELDIKDRVVFEYNWEKIDTIVGRVILNDVLPEEMRFLNETIRKKQLKKLLDDVFEVAGMEKTVEVADKLKDYWFIYATKSAVTINAYDFLVPEEKKALLAEWDEKVKEIHNAWYKWIITNEEKHNQIIEVWTDIKSRIETVLKPYYKEGNDLYALVDSGAKWNWGQLTQMAGMKWLVSNPKGEVIELPIKSSAIEGFNTLEYFIAAHAWRKGKADTALKTAESGYLTRKLVDSNQDMLVREHDCGTTQWLIITKEEVEQKRSSLFEESFGRVLFADLKDSKWNVLKKKWEMIESKDKALFENNEIDFVSVRSPITCETSSGVCQKCFGMDLSNRQLIKIWTPVWVIAAQSIWEPGTQLTMRTFHSGWVASAEWDMTQGIKRIEQLFEVRTPSNPAVVSPLDGQISFTNSWNYVKLRITWETEKKTYLVKEWYSVVVKKNDILRKWAEFAIKWKSKLKVDEDCIVLEAHKNKIIVWVQKTFETDVHTNMWIKVNDWDKVYKWQVLTGWVIDLKSYAEIVWDLEAQKYIVDEIKKVYVSQWQWLNNKYVELVVKNLFSRVYIEEVGDSLLIPWDIVRYEDFVKISRELEKEWKKAPEGKRLILGLTNLAKSTDSWMSAVSFQETMRMLVSSSIRWDIDRLNDLKANVIIGRKLPIGKYFPWNKEQENTTEQENTGE